MKITKKDLEQAASQGVVSAEQAENLWIQLEQNLAHKARFCAVHVAYYFGALIVISAMSWFMTLAWDDFGGLGIFAIAVAYILSFCLAGRSLWRQEAFRIPGGLLFTIAVSVVPLAIYGLEKWAGFWPQDSPSSYRDYHYYVKGSWIVMELCTILAGAVTLRFIRFPFLTAPVAFSLWYLSMDLTPILFGEHDFSWEQRKWVSVCFGLAMLLAAYLVDRRTEEDYSFWGYLFGLLAFWGGLSLMNSGSHWGRFGYCLINVGLMSLSVLLERRVFLVFGAFGVFGYLSYLAYDVFEDSLLFPFALTILGIGIILFGVQWHKHSESIQRRILERLPKWLVNGLPQKRVRKNPAAK